MSSTINEIKPHFWRADITGLRAIAVLPVLIFHAFPELIPGGFFGVDVFFVISGYLISGIIFKGLINNNFSYIRFYDKRVKRIIPNLLALLVFCSILGYLYLTPTELISLGKHIRSSSAFYQNFRLLHEVGYFTEDALRQPLLHLWSLAIEEQFYIVFPILCSIVWFFSKRPVCIGFLVFSIAVCSLLSSLLVKDQIFDFYFPLTRFWELGGGIILSYLENFKFFDYRKFSNSFKNILSFSGIAAILLPMIFWVPNIKHPGWITLIPVVGAVALILATPAAYFNRTLLSWKPVTFVGLISYSLYLWHWPLLSFLFICVSDITVSDKIFALLLSFLISTVVYYYIENPVRQRKEIFKIPVSIILLVILISFVGVGKFIEKKEGFPERVYLAKELSEVRKFGEWQAHDSAERISYASTTIPVTLKSGGDPEIIFAGDSHVAQYFMRAQKLSKKSGRQVGFIASWTEDVFDVSKKTPLSKAFYLTLENKNIKTIVIGRKWGIYIYKRARIEFLKYVKEKLSSRKDLKIYVLLDPPYDELDYGLKQGLTDPLKHVNRFRFDREDFIINIPDSKAWMDGNKLAYDLFKDIAIFIDPTPYVCPNERCDLLHWYRDDDHLNPVVSMNEAVWLDKIFVVKKD